MLNISQTGGVDRLDVETDNVPTEVRESDWTLQWDHTEISIVTACARGRHGVGYTFAGHAAAALVHGALGKVRDAAQVYGGGGFTLYTNRQLARQLEGWVREGIGGSR